MILMVNGQNSKEIAVFSSYFYSYGAAGAIVELWWSRERSMINLHNPGFLSLITAYDKQ